MRYSIFDSVFLVHKPCEQKSSQECSARYVSHRTHEIRNISNHKKYFRRLLHRLIEVTDRKTLSACLSCRQVSPLVQKQISKESNSDEAQVSINLQLDFLSVSPANVLDQLSNHHSLRKRRLSKLRAALSTHHDKFT